MLNMIETRVTDLEQKLNDRNKSWIVVPECSTQVNENKGSTGSANIHYDPNNNRIKGWAQTNGELLVVDDQKDMVELINILDKSYELFEKHEASRLTIRAIINTGLMDRNQSGIIDQYNLNSIGRKITFASVEARMPLDNSYDIVYLAYNNFSRFSSLKLYNQQIQKLNDIMEIGPSKKSRTLSEEYLIERLTEPKPDDLSDVITLMTDAYSRSGQLIMWYQPSPENVSELIDNAIVYVARFDGRIVSMVASEKAEELVMNSKPIDIYEISDCATLHEHRGQGLLQYCLSETLNTPEIKNADCVYIESRITHLAIDKAMINAGFWYGGILRNHVKIGGDRDVPDNTDTESLVVFYHDNKNMNCR